MNETFPASRPWFRGFLAAAPTLNSAAARHLYCEGAAPELLRTGSSTDVHLREERLRKKLAGWRIQKSGSRSPRMAAAGGGAQGAALR